MVWMHRVGSRVGPCRFGYGASPILHGCCRDAFELYTVTVIYCTSQPTSSDGLLHVAMRLSEGPCVCITVIWLVGEHW